MQEWTTSNPILQKYSSFVGTHRLNLKVTKLDNKGCFKSPAGSVKLMMKPNPWCDMTSVESAFLTVGLDLQSEYLGEVILGAVLLD